MVGRRIAKLEKFLGRRRKATNTDDWRQVVDALTTQEGCGHRIEDEAHAKLRNTLKLLIFFPLLKRPSNINISRNHHNYS